MIVCKTWGVAFEAFLLCSFSGYRKEGAPILTRIYSNPYDADAHKGTPKIQKHS